MQCCKEIPSTFSLVLSHRPHTGFKQSQPRISEKIQELYNQLEGHSDKISEETSNGILEGFSEASWPYWFHISKSWLQWISLIHVFLILGFLPLLVKTYLYISDPGYLCPQLGGLRKEAELKQLVSRARATCWPQVWLLVILTPDLGLKFTV